MRHKAAKEFVQIPAHIRVCIFLNHQRTGGVPDKAGQEALAIGIAPNEMVSVAGEFIKARAGGRKAKRRLRHKLEPVQLPAPDRLGFSARAFIEAFGGVDL